jgi:ribosomal protein L32
MFEDDDFDFEDDDDEEEDVIEVVEDEEMDFADDEEEVEEAAPAAQYESTIKKLTAENKRMKNALGKVKVQMDEINLFNARLAAASDLMRRVTMTKDQKERVVENMDRCRSIGEVKRAHRMIFEGYKTKKVVKKNRVARPNLQSVVTEEAGDINNKFARINELAGL